MDFTPITNDEQRYETSLDLIRFLLWRTTQQMFHITGDDIYYLLYDLCTNRDSYVIEKVKILSEWIVQPTKSYSRNIMKNYVPQSVFVKTIASIFWTLHMECKNIHLEKLITQNVFDACWHCVSTFNRAEPLKIAFDSLLRSLCCINPEFFNQILARTNVKSALNLLSAEELESKTRLRVHNKSDLESYGKHDTSAIDGNIFKHIITHLSTIAVASQSSSAIHQLIDSGLPKLLIHALNSSLLSIKSKATKLKSSPIAPDASSTVTCAPTFLTNANDIEKVVVDNSSNFSKKSKFPCCEHVPEILNFLAECCSEGYMRDWLGSQQIAVFWRPLLELLCNQTSRQAPETETFNRIERATIKFFSRVTACHIRNQDTLTSLLLVIIRRSQSLESQTAKCGSEMSKKMVISGFQRQIILQLFLKNEQISVSVKGEQMFKRLNGMKSELSSSTAVSNQQEIENFNTRHLLNVPLNATFKDILNDCSKKFEIIWRAKSEKKKIIESNLPETFKFNEAYLFTDEPAQLVHPDYPNILITDNTTISQLLTALQIKGHALTIPFITLEMVPRKSYRGNVDVDVSDVIDLVKMEKFPSLLQCFARHGGLTILEPLLPIICPENSHFEFVSKCSKNVTNYTLITFRQLLRLPAYADILLRYELNARYLMKILLGETEDGEGNNIFSLKFVPSLRILPFIVFRELLNDSPLNMDDGIALRCMAIGVGAMHSVLYILKNCKLHSECKYDYSRKGTGFSTGPINDTREQLKREDLLTVLLQVLSSYINPGDKISSSLFTDDLMSFHVICENMVEVPSLFVMQLEDFGLIAILNYYLENDSILDIFRNVPLYRAVLQLLRAMLSPQFISLLTMKSSPNSLSSVELIIKMKACVKTYERFKPCPKGHVQWNYDDFDDDELTLFIPDLYDTALLIQKTTKVNDCVDGQIRNEKEGPNDNSMFVNSFGNSKSTTANISTNVWNGNEQQGINKAASAMQCKSIEQRYLDVMKKLQFNTYDIIADLYSFGNGYRFAVSYNFAILAGTVRDRFQATQMKRLTQDAAILSKSLPLSYSSSIFVRCDTNRLDVMKVLITGPAGTPYANGCFEFDVFFPPDYPNVPMMINFETTGRHTVRFNPNLYNDGKVCFSVLNTWHGRPEEMWNSQTSSFLQVLVSIQSLILVPEPYFNEPGFERSRGTPSGTHSSREYNSNIYQACVQWAMLEQIRNPNACFKDVIHTHFWLKRFEICAQIEKWIQEFTTQDDRCKANINLLLLYYQSLREELSKLKTPPGMEDLDAPFDPAVALSYPMPTTLNHRDENFIPIMSLHF